jgi:hypothetical protein
MNQGWKAVARWIAAGLMLAALTQAGGIQAGEVSESVTTANVSGPPFYVRAPGGWRRVTGTNSGSMNVTQVNPNVTNYVSQAMGPTTHRENNGGSPWVATYARDSTAAIELLGGTKVQLWFNCLPDTSVDSATVIHWYALGIRMNLTQAVDTTISAAWLPLLQPGTVGGLANVIAAYYQGAANGGVTASNVATQLLAGEVLIPLQVTNSGTGGSRCVLIDLGGTALASNYVSFTLRSFGHWSNNPQASFIRLPTYKTKVRMDVVVIK